MWLYKVVVVVVVIAAAAAAAVEPFCGIFDPSRINTLEQETHVSNISIFTSYLTEKMCTGVKRPGHGLQHPP